MNKPTLLKVLASSGGKVIPFNYCVSIDLTYPPAYIVYGNIRKEVVANADRVEGTV
ncbi:MAG: hypothetical protein ABII27_02585 [bacterium]